MTGNYHRFVEAVTKMIQPDTTSPAKPSQPEQYLVHIYEKNESICIGAYIKGFNNFHVVTTASCVINVKMPLLRAHMRTANQTQLIRTVKELLVHPQYRHNKVAFNIALLKLEKNFAPYGIPGIIDTSNQLHTNCLLYHLLKLEKNFAPYGIPGIIDTSNQLHTNCLLYHLFVDILNKEKTRMVSCPKLSVSVTSFACLKAVEVSVTSFACLKAVEAVCLRDCKFIAVCEGKL
ncbi:Trypsin [Popillia japonica]|uniref:Trypsin n=1 Tax=Popillia japonica TaxID=7064 RepID=A0AAW1L7G9_POPJA